MIFLFLSSTCPTFLHNRWVKLGGLSDMSIDILTVHRNRSSIQYSLSFSLFSGLFWRQRILKYVVERSDFRNSPVARWFILAVVCERSVPSGTAWTKLRHWSKYFRNDRMRNYGFSGGIDYYCHGTWLSQSLTSIISYHRHTIYNELNLAVTIRNLGESKEEIRKDKNYSNREFPWVSSNSFQFDSSDSPTCRSRRKHKLQDDKRNTNRYDLNSPRVDARYMIMEWLFGTWSQGADIALVRWSEVSIVFNQRWSNDYGIVNIRYSIGRWHFIPIKFPTLSEFITIRVWKYPYREKRREGSTWTTCIRIGGKEECARTIYKFKRLMTIFDFEYTIYVPIYIPWYP